MAEKKLAELCQTTKDGEVIKTLITVENFKRLKKLMKTLDIELMTDNPKSFSYRQYCKLFSSYMFKREKVGGRPRCQAINHDGERCLRPAAKFLTVDLTEVQVLPKIPGFLRRKLGTKKVEKLKLIGFANTCCFYCWQHTAMYAAEGSTFTSNLAYYTTHPEDILGIFFEDVEVKKVARLLTYKVKVSKLRSADEIIKRFYSTKAAMKGALSRYYWGVFFIVYMYDSLKRYLSGWMTEKQMQKMVERGAEVLLKANS